MQISKLCIEKRGGGISRHKKLKIGEKWGFNAAPTQHKLLQWAKGWEFFRVVKYSINAGKGLDWIMIQKAVQIPKRWEKCIRFLGDWVLTLTKFLLHHATYSLEFPRTKGSSSKQAIGRTPNHSGAGFHVQLVLFCVQGRTWWRG